MNWLCSESKNDDIELKSKPLIMSMMVCFVTIACFETNPSLTLKYLGSL